jgi:hypothetical protein
MIPILVLANDGSIVEPLMSALSFVTVKPADLFVGNMYY